MNWYRMAQKIQERIERKGLKPEDLFSFYSLQSLSPETFIENPDLLYDFIESINSIRKYYLDFLIPRIIRELGHILDEPEAIDNSYCEPDEEMYSFEDWIEDEGYSKDDEDVAREEYLEFMLNQNWTTEGKSVTLSDARTIEEIQKKFQNSYLSNNDFETIEFLFEDLPWDPSYGGVAWSRITEWTKKLYNTSEINISSNINSVLSQARNLVYILDTLHSLHHNNALALSELPNRENQWILGVLELAKYSRDPLFLSYFSNDTKLMNVLYQEKRIKGESPKSQREYLYNMLINMSEYDKFQFLRAINYKPIINILLTLDVDLIQYIIFNTRSNLTRMNAASIFKELVKKHGLKEVLSSLPIRLSKYSYSFVKQLPDTMIDKIEKLYEKDGVRPNYRMLRRGT